MKRVEDIVKVRFRDHPHGLKVKLGGVRFVCGDKSVNYTGILLTGKHKGRAIFFHESQIMQSVPQGAGG